MVVENHQYLKVNLFPTILYASQYLSFDGMSHFPISHSLSPCKGYEYYHSSASPPSFFSFLLTTVDHRITEC